MKRSSAWPVSIVKYLAGLVCSLALVIISAGIMAADRVGVDYDIAVTLDPAKRLLKGQSSITIEQPGELVLALSRRFKVTRIHAEGMQLIPDERQHASVHTWRVIDQQGESRRIEIDWQGELAMLDTSLDHQQTLGRPVPVSGVEGSFLPDASAWFPYITNALARYRVSLALPPGQRGLVAGRLVEETEAEQEGYRARFEFPFPAEGIDLIAGPYQIASLDMQSITGKTIHLRTYFHSEISELADAYLSSVKEHITFYESWIGEYPFSEFSVVSSPTPTGFGMPTLTYLGIEVLKLPFIRATSLGHEVLHNWWGNGVYPNYKKGNWSEGLTTFMADYAYQERTSDEAAREMRLGWLRDFAALSPGQDAPLVAFTSRTHGASKIVGYNKAAMVFFMLRDWLGEEAFDQAIQAFWQKHRFRIASWQDLQRVFETTAGQSLHTFFSQWLSRPGAPAIRIIDATYDVSDSGHLLNLTLQQSIPVYQVRVPILVRGQAGEEMHFVDLERARQSFTIVLQARPQAILLDPDLRLFRQLSEQEAPPILREVMVNQATKTILLAEGIEDLAIAHTLVAKLQGRQAEFIEATSQLPTKPVLVIGLASHVDRWLTQQKLPEKPKELAMKGSAQAWAIRRPDGATLAIVSAQDTSSLSALIRPLPHYGRQSYIVFDGSTAIAKGIWPMQPQITEVD